MAHNPTKTLALSATRTPDSEITEIHVAILNDHLVDKKGNPRVAAVIAQLTFTLGGEFEHKPSIQAAAIIRAAVRAGMTIIGGDVPTIIERIDRDLAFSNLPLLAPEVNAGIVRNLETFEASPPHNLETVALHHLAESAPSWLAKPLAAEQPTLALTPLIGR